MNLHPRAPGRALFWATLSICVVLFLSIARLSAQSVILDSYGQGGQDAGIDVINPSFGGVTVEWCESTAFANVSVSVGLASFIGTGDGWAMINTDSDTIAEIDFEYPANYGRVDLFDGISLPAGTIYLTVGAYDGQDVGWGVTAEGTMDSADGVNYIGTFTRWGQSSPVDFSVASVPEPSACASFALGILTIIIQRRLPKIPVRPSRAPIKAL